jgi:hypothetical protein
MSITLLTKSEHDFLRRLSTPQKIQDFLDSIPFNHEEHGQTVMSPRTVLQTKRAHCIEGALLAGVALWLQGRPPLIISLKVKHSDYDHIITIFEENGYYGAISKTNHNVLRYRDPIYKSIRELVMSYFHEYFLTVNGEKTLLGYTKPINIKKFGSRWITSEENLWDIAEKIYDTPTLSIVPEKNKKFLRKATPSERASASIPEWKKSSLS